MTGFYAFQASVKNISSGIVFIQNNYRGAGANV